MAMLATRVSDETKKYINDVAKAHNQTPSDFLRNLIEEYLDDQFDIQLVEEARAYEKAHPDARTYSFDEVVKKLGLENEI